MRRHVLFLFMVLVLVLVVATTPCLHAQRSPSSKNHVTVKQAYREVVARARRFTVRVLSDGEQVALGTIVDRKGLILTKASELGEDLECELPGGETYKARKIASNEKDDLALLRIQASSPTALEAADWSDGVGLKPGSFLATVGLEEAPDAVGVLSTEVHGRDRVKGYLGVRMHQQQSPARLREIMPNTAASKAGLEPDDVILEMDGKKISASRQFISAIGRHKPGEEIAIRLRRDEQELELKIALGEQTDRRGRRSSQERLWGPLSKVRTGFGQVLQHDSVLKPNQCGGPLVDLDGKVVGINISRVGRVETLALTAEVAKAVLAKLRPSKAVVKKPRKSTIR